MASEELVLARSGADALQRVLKSVRTDRPEQIIKSADFLALGPMAQRAVLLHIKQTGNLQMVDTSRGGWWPIVRESYSGAWQQNAETTVDVVLAYSAVYACTTLISSDVGKCRVRLVEEVESGIWDETESPAFSPVLRKPNHYQNRIQFFTWWMTSKLIHGNTYALKQRDDRNVVRALYLLDPTRVDPLIAPNGDVYYRLKKDTLSTLEDALIVPAMEIIHDLQNALFHPLVGTSAIYACGLAAVQGLRIQQNSARFFLQGATPSGVLTAPGAISQTTADRAKAYWESEFTGTNSGKVAVLGDGLKYEPMTMKSTDAQLIEQLRWTAENVCTAYHVPPYMIGVGPPPNYNNIEALNQQYYSQCLQTHFESIELALDWGLGLAPDRIEGKRLGIEFDLDDLLRMDTPTRVKAAADSLQAGVAINEVRKRYHNLGRVKGGDSPYMQMQYFSVEALAERDANKPFAKPAPAPVAAPSLEPDMDDDDAMMPPEDMERAVADLLRKELAA